MIEINLLPGKKRAAPAGGGFKLGLKLPDFRAIIANITNPWLLAASAAWVIVLGGGLALFVTSRARIAVLNSRLEEVRAEKRRFDAVIAQKRQSEKMRDSLVAEIGIIRQIDADRYVWPHILDQVTKRRRRPWFRSCRSRSWAARWTFRPTPRFCGSSPLRRGSVK